VPSSGKKASGFSCPSCHLTTKPTHNFCAASAN